MAKPIRVLIVDDSLVFREFLSRALSQDPSMEIVGAFSNPIEAAEKIKQLRPDVMTVDMEMPRMRGDEFLRTVLPQHPTVRAVVISSLSSNVFDAMQAGAIDFVGKPGSQTGYTNEQFLRDIRQKIHIAAAASVRAPAAMRPRAADIAAGPPARANLASVTQKNIIAIGASTGGTEAIIAVLQKFPANTPGVVIVQHMPPVFTRMYAERIDRICAMQAKEAQHGDRVERGKILLAPGGEQQMRLMRDNQGYYVQIRPGEKVSGHCPSVDVLFDSVARVAGAGAVGVILTGMGADGAQGITAMRKAGAHTIGQDQATCVVYGMPKVAYERGGIVEQLPLPSIGNAVLRRFSR